MRLRLAPALVATLPTALAFLLASAGPVRAQSPTIEGNRETVAGDCHGGDAVVSGNRNEVTLKGFCRDVTIRGNENHVLAEMTSRGRISIPGNGNRVDYRIPSGGVQPEKRLLGSGNQVQQVAGDSETPQSGVVEPRDVGRLRQ